MDIFDLLKMIGGLCLFLFGMNIMGQALERRAGNKLQTLLGKMTTGKIAGLLTGLAVTAVIQSSSATTVMVVGFVNSGLMTLKQAINVIMGANIGTTVTGWILSLAGINSGNVFVRLLEPSSFTPILALIGIIFYMFGKKGRRKDTGMILLGFATLMFGMETMSGAVSGLRAVPAFTRMFLLFKNPVLGVLAGAMLTAIIQSSSAAVGILQAFAMTGQVTLGAAVPLIMGTSIGTCATALLSSVGANREAKRASMAHLLFNVIGTVVWLLVYWILKEIFDPAMLDAPASMLGIAVVNTAFKVLSTVLLLPLSGMLEKLCCRLVRGKDTDDETVDLDERLFATPPIALERSREVAVEMAEDAMQALKNSLGVFNEYSSETADKIRRSENRSDHYEDALGTYLLELSARPLSAENSAETVMLLKVIGDFERITDHAVNLVEAAEELRDKGLKFSEAAAKELNVIMQALNDITELTLISFIKNDPEKAADVEPLEQVIDGLKERLRTNHILRMQQGQCSIETGFVWSDLLTDIERVSDHCSNIAGCVIDSQSGNLNLHASLQEAKHDKIQFGQKYNDFVKKYVIL